MYNFLVKIKCPIYEKYGLSIEEAAEYFNIGEKKLHSLANEYAGESDSFVYTIGNKHVIKRKKFEEFLDNTSVI